MTPPHPVIYDHVGRGQDIRTVAGSSIDAPFAVDEAVNYALADAAALGDRIFGFAAVLNGVMQLLDDGSMFRRHRLLWVVD